ncbi:unnamed protein product [Cochlearia groenlandica]
MSIKLLFHGLTLVLMLTFGQVLGERMRWSRKEMVEMAGYGENKLSSILLTASLVSSSSTPIPGVIIGIICQTGFRNRSKFWIKGVTNESGQFVIDLPSHLHAIPDLDKACYVRPLFVPKPYQCCPKIHRGIRLVSSSNGFRVYTAGNITLHRAPCKY